ncbi:flagellar basal body rod protein FlgB [Clostridium thailandense]|uniref:Flagellar basal body rod protein FlgB n=1 Tax=Clostridium thailandense TaxID=2794346 RepID=A0A949X3B2_9CLOT|nr:flagellar basal body rod protein FlgB [Clostridium thailandense]MBV7272223.1 flagellar basal body rod protein FlgB [Clostridium thailandense]MCH5136492.1 flagellar basal body rod protein FlgB [Clostridiaceae bacterium UIB06]
MNITDLSKDQLTYNLLKKSLDATSARSKAISNNIANINTKGYKRQYVTFEESLNQSTDNLELKNTDDKHMQYGSEYGEIKTETDNTTSIREDGNNVDVDNEMTNAAANTLMYNALINQVNSRLSAERYVISGK